MTILEKLIREKTDSYRIKKTSNDILKEYNLRKRSVTKKSSFNFMKFAFVPACAAFACAAVVLSLNLKKDDVVIPVINNTVAESSYKKVAKEMKSAAAIIKSVDANYIQTLANKEEGLQIAKSRFVNVKNVLTEVYNEETSVEILNTDKSEYKYLLNIDNEYKVYLNKDLSNPNELIKDEKGLIVINSKEYKITDLCRNTDELGYDMSMNIVVSENIKIHIEDKESPLKTYNYTLSVNKIQQETIDILEVSSNIYKIKEYNKGATHSDYNKIEYTVTKNVDIYSVEYFYTNSKTTYGEFEA